MYLSAFVFGFPLFMGAKQRLVPSWLSYFSIPHRTLTLLRRMLQACISAPRPSSWLCFVGLAPIFSGWRRHSQGRCGEPVLINDENVQTYLPDLPEEYFRMPYSQAKSDIIRYGLLFHHGGIYMDTDFLVVKDLGEVLDLAQKYDLVSYTDALDGPFRGTSIWDELFSTKRGWKQETILEKRVCSRNFGSNFMAARKGSVFMKTVWDRQKQLMQAHCPVSEKGEGLETLCCSDNATEQCRVAWGGIGEKVSHPVFDELEGESAAFSSYCFSGERGFTPPRLLNFLATPELTLADAEDIWEKMEVDEPSARDPFGRIMYHTFNSAATWSDFSCKQIFNTSSLYGKLNYLSFTTGSGSKSLPATPEYMEWLQKNKMSFMKNHDGLPCQT
ncbi:unnamed protein product [Effrenium voratum]|nr:unnamed protein product [Effrenium voratum]